jgi:hypothetical protein
MKALKDGSVGRSRKGAQLKGREPERLQSLAYAMYLSPSIDTSIIILYYLSAHPM